MVARRQRSSNESVREIRAATRRQGHRLQLRVADAPSSAPAERIGPPMRVWTSRQQCSSSARRAIGDLDPGSSCRTWSKGGAVNRLTLGAAANCRRNDGADHQYRQHFGKRPMRGGAHGGEPCRRLP
jgi:hypothetical protein